MATTNLFSSPVFKDGAFTANDPAVRRFAVRKTLDAIDLGRRARRAGVRDVGRPRGRRVRRGQGRPARARPLRGGRRPLLRATSATAATTCASRSSPSRTSRAATSSCRPSATRSRSSSELEWPEMVGLNPEFAHETMSGLSFHHAVAQALWHGKLFHIDLNAQRIGKYDQDFRFGSEGIRDAFYLVKLLEDAGWDGMRHFDAHAYRTEDADGVWDFARGCMRTYLILAEKADASDDDPEIQEALRPRQGGRPGRAQVDRTGPAAVDAVRARDRRRGRARPRTGLRPRAPRPARHRAPPRRPVSRCRWSPGSTRRRSPTKVEVRDADTGELVAHGRAPHPPTTPPRSEQDPDAWWEAFVAAVGQCRRRPGRRGRHRGRRPAARAGRARRPTATRSGPAKLWNDTESAPDADPAGGAARTAAAWADGVRQRAGGRLHDHQAGLAAPRPSPRSSTGSPACCCPTTGSPCG